jgi:hypothetical protein
MRYAEGVMAWHQGRLTDVGHLVREATVQWHRCGDRMDANANRCTAQGYANVSRSHALPTVGHDLQLSHG